MSSEFAEIENNDDVSRTNSIVTASSTADLMHVSVYGGVLKNPGQEVNVVVAIPRQTQVLMFVLPETLPSTAKGLLKLMQNSNDFCISRNIVNEKYFLHCTELKNVGFSKSIFAYEIKKKLEQFSLDLEKKDIISVNKINNFDSKSVILNKYF